MKYNKSRKNKPYKKPCKRCEKIFNPTSKFNYICKNCIQRRGKKTSAIKSNTPLSIEERKEVEWKLKMNKFKKLMKDG